MRRLYLITDSPYYYPSPGATDWRLVTVNGAEARSEFTRVCEEERHMGSVICLIELSVDEDGTTTVTELESYSTDGDD